MYVCMYVCIRTEFSSLILERISVLENVTFGECVYVMYV